jgi:hypothetical protein
LTKRKRRNGSLNMMPQGLSRVVAIPVVMSPKLNILAIAVLAGLIGLCGQAHAAEELVANAIGTSERSDARLGLNIFGLSLHTDRDAGYNEINPGVGLRYDLWRAAPNWTVFGDSSVYYDSSREWAKYAGVGTYYSFTTSWKIGATIVYAQSESYNRGKPFFAAVPSMAIEYRRFVINVVLLPSENAASKVTGLALFLTIPLGKGG